MIKLNHLYQNILLENFRFGLPYDSEQPVEAVLWRNGSPTAEVVGVSQVDDGKYFLSFTTLGEADGWSEDDRLLLRVTTVVDGLAYTITKFDSLLVGGGIADVSGIESLLLSGQVVQIPPVSQTGEILGPIVIGDDYTTDTNRAFKWLVAEPPLDISKTVCFFGARRGATQAFLVQGIIDTVAIDGNDYWELTFDLPRTVTDDLSETLYSHSVELQQDDPILVVNVVVGTFKAIRDAVPSLV